MTEEIKKDAPTTISQNEGEEITVTHNVLSGTCVPPFTMKKGSTMGEIIQAIEVRQCESLTVDSAFLIEGKSVGHDIPLSTKMETYVVLHNVMFATVRTSVHLPYEAWKAGELWPPAANFYDVEPINLIPIGEYNDDKCAHCLSAAGTYHADHDNSYNRIVVLSYGPTVTERVAYNLRTIGAYVIGEMKKGTNPILDPLIRRPIVSLQRFVTQLTSLQIHPTADLKRIPVIDCTASLPIGVT